MQTWHGNRLGAAAKCAERVRSLLRRIMKGREIRTFNSIFKNPFFKFVTQLGAVSRLLVHVPICGNLNLARAKKDTAVY